MRAVRNLERALGIMLLVGDAMAFLWSYLFLWSMETETFPLPSALDPHSRRFIIVAVPLLTLSLTIGGSYRRLLRSGPGYLIICLIRGLIVGVALLLAAITLLDIPVEHRVILQFIGLSLTVALIWRSLFQEIRRILARRGFGRTRVLAHGLGEKSREIIGLLQRLPDLPYQLIGVIAREDQAAGAEVGAEVIPLAGDWEARLRALRPGAVLLPINVEEAPPSDLVDWCERNGVRLQRVASASQIGSGEARIKEFLGIPWQLRTRPGLRPINNTLKRLTDLALGGIAMILLAPVFLLIAVLIKLDSPGPVFYRQRRMTKNQRVFMIFKFRSMIADAEKMKAALERMNEADGPIFKIKHDPRITRVGRILRRTSLDELPQLLNVLAGDLSLVGPRPPVPDEVAQYQPWQLRRLDAVQGMTGLWQISGRSQLSFEEMVLLDIYYIENWSLFLDLEIMIDTIPAVLFAKGAY